MTEPGGIGCDKAALDALENQVSVLRHKLVAQKAINKHLTAEVSILREGIDKALTYTGDSARSHLRDALHKLDSASGSPKQLPGRKDVKGILSDDPSRRPASADSRQKPKGLPMERRLESKCDHEMETTGSGTYCLKPDCDVNWI